MYAKTIEELVAKTAHAQAKFMNWAFFQAILNGHVRSIRELDFVVQNQPGRYCMEIRIENGAVKLASVETDMRDAGFTLTFHFPKGWGPYKRA